MVFLCKERKIENIVASGTPTSIHGCLKERPGKKVVAPQVPAPARARQVPVRKVVRAPPAPARRALVRAVRVRRAAPQAPVKKVVRVRVKRVVHHLQNLRIGIKREFVFILVIIYEGVSLLIFLLLCVWFSLFDFAVLFLFVLLKGKE